MLCNNIPQPLIWITYAIGLCNLPSNSHYIAVFICIFFLRRLLKCASPQALKANFAIRTGLEIMRSHSKFLLNIVKDALVILVCFGFKNKVNSLFHVLTSSSSFRCCPVPVQSTKLNSNCQVRSTKRTFLSRRRTDQADCWSSSSGSKVRCPLVLLFDMNPCNADHCIIRDAHNPTITERHTVICSATAKSEIVCDLACLHIKFAVIVKRLSFFERIKTNSLLAMLSTNFHTYLHPITTAVQTARHTLMNSQTSIACRFSNRLSAVSLIVRSD
nr:MAG TPA_asm: hypothetical protein [Caudoviricetes sp.]